MQVVLKEANFAGKILDEILVEIENEKITVGELMRLKVEKEVEKYNEQVKKENQGYLNDYEEKLNLVKNKNAVQRKLADVEKEVYRAFEAFQNNQIFITVDKTQVETLEEEVLLNGDTDVSFVRMTPLVGG